MTGDVNRVIDGIKAGSGAVLRRYRLVLPWRGQLVVAPPVEECIDLESLDKGDRELRANRGCVVAYEGR